MAVYRRRYQPYEGRLTPLGARGAVFTRYAFKQLFASRLFVMYFVLCFGAPLVGAILIYLHYNALGLAALKTTVEQLVPINGEFFFRFLIIQTSLGTLLAAIIGPGLIAPDLTNNALPLYLARPLTRTQYVTGKLTVLASLMSILTWVPLMLMYGLQCGLAGWSWFAGHVDIAFGIMGGSLLWITVVSLLTLALSAWVRWKPVATLLVYGYFLVSAGLAALVNDVLETNVGKVLSLIGLMQDLWGRSFGRTASDEALPPLVSIVAILLTCGFFTLLLRRRIRAYEVVR